MTKEGEVGDLDAYGVEVVSENGCPVLVRGDGRFLELAPPVGE